MMNGGKRPGAGRKKGSTNKATKAIKAKVAEMQAAGLEMPLDFLNRMMREPEPVQANGENTLAFIDRRARWDARRMQAGIAAAPYQHNRLSSVEHTGPKGGPIQHRVELVFVKGKG